MRFADPVISATLPYMFIDKVAIITGASRGIGLAIARKLHANGCKVAMCARSTDALKRHAEEMGPDRALPVGMDIRDAANVEDGVTAAAKRFGKIDIIVNNAGISGVTPIDDVNTSRGWISSIQTSSAHTTLHEPLSPTCRMAAASS